MCLPLTTPALRGARARLTQHHQPELVVPGNLGGRGQTITPWAGIADQWKPRDHDLRLLERIAALRALTPATIREARRQVAIEGYAGRRVKAATRLVIAADRKAELMTHYYILLALARQMQPGSLGGGPVRPAHVAPLAHRAIRQLAAQTHRDRDGIADTLNRLGPVLAPIGLGPRVGMARLPALLADIQAMRQSVAALPIATAWEAEAAGLITCTADIVLACLAAALADARSLVDPVAGLIQLWMDDAAGTAARLGRAEWLADGWPLLCQSWALATTVTERMRLLDDMVLSLPPVPEEVRDWPGFVPGMLQPGPIGPNPAAPPQAALVDLVARAETLLALAA